MTRASNGFRTSAPMGKWLSAAAVCTLAACTPQAEPRESSRAGEATAMPQPHAPDCPVIASRGWNAWIDAMPGPGSDRPTLNIAGEVDLPTPGYTLELVGGPADRAMPPSQHFTLVATAPQGMVAQVITPSPVKYRAKATYKAYRSIKVLCGGKLLASIDEVPVAQ